MLAVALVSVLFQSLIILFGLPITFRMISGSEVKLHVQCRSKGMEEVGYESHAVIRSDMAWDTVIGEEVKKGIVV